VWPVYYPEMDKYMPTTFANGWDKLSDGEQSDFKKCPLWISSYSRDQTQIGKKTQRALMKALGHKPFAPLTFDFVKAWGSWAFWQYCAAESWSASATDDKWTPYSQSRNNEADKLGTSFLSFSDYPRGSIGSAIPLDCNLWNTDWSETGVKTIHDFWEKHGWIPVNSPK